MRARHSGGKALCVLCLTAVNTQTCGMFLGHACSPQSRGLRADLQNLLSIQSKERKKEGGRTRDFCKASFRAGLFASGVENLQLTFLGTPSRAELTTGRSHKRDGEGEIIKIHFASFGMRRPTTLDVISCVGSISRSQLQKWARP